MKNWTNYLMLAFIMYELVMGGFIELVLVKLQNNSLPVNPVEYAVVAATQVMPFWITLLVVLFWLPIKPLIMLIFVLIIGGLQTLISWVRRPSFAIASIVLIIVFAFIIKIDATVPLNYGTYQVQKIEGQKMVLQDGTKIRLRKEVNCSLYNVSDKNAKCYYAYNAIPYPYRLAIIYNQKDNKAIVQKTPINKGMIFSYLIYSLIVVVYWAFLFTVGAQTKNNFLYDSAQE